MKRMILAPAALALLALVIPADSAAALAGTSASVAGTAAAQIETAATSALRTIQAQSSAASPVQARRAAPSSSDVKVTGTRAAEPTLATTATNEMVRSLETGSSPELGSLRQSTTTAVVSNVSTTTTNTTTTTTTSTTSSTTVKPTSNPNAPWVLAVSGKSFTIESGDQTTIDACKPGMVTKWYSPLPGQGGTTHLAGHNYCGFQYWSSLPMGTIVTITHDSTVYRYKIVSRTMLATQGGSSAGLIHDDLILQTCAGSGTAMTYARLV